MDTSEAADCLLSLQAQGFKDKASVRPYCFLTSLDKRSFQINVEQAQYELEKGKPVELCLNEENDLPSLISLSLNFDSSFHCATMPPVFEFGNAKLFHVSVEEPPCQKPCFVAPDNDQVVKVKPSPTSIISLVFPHPTHTFGGYRPIHLEATLFYDNGISRTEKIPLQVFSILRSAVSLRKGKRRVSLFPFPAQQKEFWRPCDKNKVLPQLEHEDRPEDNDTRRNEESSLDSQREFLLKMVKSKVEANLREEEEKLNHRRQKMAHFLGTLKVDDVSALRVAVQILDFL